MFSTFQELLQSKTSISLVSIFAVILHICLEYLV